jgi:hypothetical protein
MTRDEAPIAVGGKVATVMDTEGIVCHSHGFHSTTGARTNNTPASSSSTTYRPEQVRILNSIDRPDNPICSHNLVIQLVRNVGMWDHMTHFDLEQVVNLKSLVCFTTR